MIVGAAAIIATGRDQEWSDGTVTACYSFRHALYQQVVYQRLAVARRLLHQRIGEYLARAYEAGTETLLHNWRCTSRRDGTTVVPCSIYDVRLRMLPSGMLIVRPWGT